LSSLFGYSFDEKRYRSVIRACALEPDLTLLSDRDETFLSGGQKARLALARAVYAPTSHILLDDVLSAVDSHTARHLLDYLFDTSKENSLLKGRTVVLVTHHVDLVLPHASWHVELEVGRVVRQGAVEKATKAEEKVEEGLARMEEEEEEEGGEATGTSKALPAASKSDGRAEGWASGGVKSAMYTTCVLLSLLPYLPNFTESLLLSYLSSSGYLTWLLVAVFLLARPAFSYLEQFWLRSAFSSFLLPLLR
jgi:ABC-type multidrug transport system ATPase subunit